MSDLMEFLRARLAEDEHRAKAATRGPWRVANVDHGAATVDGPDALQDGGYDSVTKTRRQVTRPLTVIPPDVDYGPVVDLADAEHIARHDPARVLAEVDAKRRILDECNWGGPDHADVYEEVLRRLTLPYADHPDYDESWRP